MPLQSEYLRWRQGVLVGQPCLQAVLRRSTNKFLGLF